MHKTGALILILLATVMTSACVSTPSQEEQSLIDASKYNTELGLGYLRQGKYEIALGKLRKAVKQNPKNATAHHYLAQLYHILGKSKEAQHHFEIAFKYASKEDLLLRNNYGAFLCEKGQYEQANKLFFELLDNPLYSARGQLMENIGLCALHQGNLKIAEEYLTKALRLIPESPKSLLAMAQMSFDKQEYSRAREFYYQYLRVARQTSTSLWLGILIEHRAGNKNRVSSYSILLKGKYPDSKEAALLKKMEAKGVL